jgi:hypothetical protein
MRRMVGYCAAPRSEFRLSIQLACEAGGAVEGVGATEAQGVPWAFASGVASERSLSDRQRRRSRSLTHLDTDPMLRHRRRNLRAHVLPAQVPKSPTEGSPRTTVRASNWMQFEWTKHHTRGQLKRRCGVTRPPRAESRTSVRASALQAQRAA